MWETQQKKQGKAWRRLTKSTSFRMIPEAAAAQERVAAKRAEVVEALGKFIASGMERWGATLRIPASTFAQVLIATSDAVVLGSELDDVDLYRPIVDMYVSAIKLP